MSQTLTKLGSNSAKLRLRLGLVAAVCALAGMLALFFGPTGQTANPSSGTVSEANPVVTWDGPIFMAPTGSATCGGPNDPSCDNFSLNVVPPSSGSYQVRITVQPFGAGDWDLQVYSGTSVAGSSGNAPSAAEIVTLSNPAGGTYTVAAAPFAPSPGFPGSYSARAEWIRVPTPPPPPPPGTEYFTYANHVAPAPLGQGAAEPSIGANWLSGRTMYQSGLQSLRVTWDDCSSPAEPTWENKTFPTTGIVSLDPIGFLDPRTGRYFASQLSAKCSTAAYTDNDGDTWIPSQGCGIDSGVDHQSIGGGRYVPGTLGLPLPPPAYQHAVYYCAQDLVLAGCARSDNGGVTFGPAVPAYTLGDCGGLHGEPNVAPNDGTVYLPNKGCNGQQAVVVSEDNGLTWTVRRIPGTTAGEWDPDIGVGLDGTVYVGMTNGDGHPTIAVSKDQGETWSAPVDVGLPFDIDNTAFPAVVAGDGDRAAFAFLGIDADQPGGGGDDPNWPDNNAAWHVYVAHTYNGRDAAPTWTTIDVTPNDPVQRGTICAGGTTGCPNGTRNLLDFNRATVDKFGRALIGWADGCVGPCVTGTTNSFTEVATISRQVGGRRLFAQYDVLDVPAAPRVTVKSSAGPPPSNIVNWEEPDDHGSRITAYKVYRRTQTTSRTLIYTTASPTERSYTDTNIVAGQTYFYSVTATNAQGEGPFCEEVPPEGGGEPENPCVAPGVTILEDATGDASTTQPEHDVQKLSIAEPVDIGAGKIMFILKMAGLANPTPNTTWPILFQSSNGIDFAARMHTNALGQVFFTVATGPNNTNSLLNAGVPADPASNFSADGTIRIVVPRAAIGNPQPGQALTLFLVRIRVEAGGVALTPDNMPDSLARTGAYTVTGNENCSANAPDAVDDSATTEENVPVTINVVANDDPNDTSLTVTAVGDPPNGTATNNGDGTVTYQPDLGFTGNDAFTYTVRNNLGFQDTATVRVTVTPFCALEPTGSFQDDFEPGAEPGWGVNTAANALGPLSPTWQVTTDVFAHSPTHSFFSDATTLDTKDDRLVAPPQDLSSTSHLVFWHRFGFEDGFDGAVLEVSTDGGNTWVDVGATNFVEGGYNGTISGEFGSPIAGRPAWTGFSEFINAMNRVEVNLGVFAGQDVRVRFRLATDPLVAGSLPGQGWWIDDVEFTNLLEPGDCNKPPIARDDTAGTQKNVPVMIDVLANDTDPENDTLTVTAVGDPPNGSVTNNSSSVTYTPDMNFVGTDNFTYTISDGNGNTSTANVTVIVSEGPNGPPVANDDAAMTQENTPVTINVLVNDTDPDGDSLSVDSVTDPPNGAATINADQTVTYTPDANFFGTDTFDYTIHDGKGGFDTATVTVTVERRPNSPPNAVDDSATTQENTAVTINVVANDSDPNGDPLTVTNVTQPANGTTTNNGDGTVTYSPNSGFTGTDTFNYTISDGRGGTDTAQVSVMVQPRPSTEGGKVTGSGAIADGPSGEADFNLNGQVNKGVAKGRVSYSASSITVKGSVQSLHITGSHAELSGSCELENGTPCRYVVKVDDLSESGTGGDTFAIQVFNMAGLPIYQNSGVLKRGNIQVH
jgi:hypothetical protein